MKQWLDMNLSCALTKKVLMMRRVLHLVASDGLYGAERVILNLSKELMGAHYVPVVGVICKEGAESPEIIKVATALGIDTLVISLRSKFDPFGLITLGKELKNNRINLVHSHGYKPTFFAFPTCKFLKIPLVVTCHLWFNKGNAKLRFYHAVEAKIMRFVPIVVGVSEDICAELRRNLIRPNRVKLVHNGICLEHYQSCLKGKEQQLLKEEFGIDKNDFVIGMVGRLCWQKAHRCLLDAMRILRDGDVQVKCLIVGDGPLREELEMARDRMELTNIVLFTGFRNDILAFLDILDVFVLTSEDEGLPMVLLEAMAMKKAIVSTPVGEIDKVIQHNINGVLFPVGDSSALAGHIKALKESQVSKEHLGENARRTFEEGYTASAMAMKYLAIYESLV